MDKELAKARQKRYRDSHKEELKAYWESVKDKRNEYRRSEEYKAKNNKRQKNRYKTDPVYRLNKCMHSNVSGCMAAKGLRKRNRQWEELVGYTKEELMVHIQSLFLEGMTWENYGEWHIDHIKPKSFFNYKDVTDDEFKECWSLGNLQPLWAEDNIRKGNRYIG